MKFIPLIKVKNISRAVDFYTRILDFELKYPDEELNVFCVSLINGDSEFLLTETDGIFGISVMVMVGEVDRLYRKYLERGLILPHKEDSPVHEHPINQSWGLREFYVTDEDGNTLRFATPIL